MLHKEKSGNPESVLFPIGFYLNVFWLKRKQNIPLVGTRKKIFEWKVIIAVFYGLTTRLTLESPAIICIRNCNLLGFDYFGCLIN
jgi:hypothetical protein